MQKPNGYEEAITMGNTKEPIELGGHHLIIKQVEETVNSKNKPMIVVLFDFDQIDKQAGLLMKEFKEDDRADKKWPSRGAEYIMVNDYEDPSKTSRQYKTFCTCFEQSNGTKINWTDDAVVWANQFKNKKIGGAFGLVHEVWNGREIVKTKLRWFISDNKVDCCEVPFEKLLSEAKKKELSTSEPSNESPDGFINIPDDLGDIPFN